MSTLITEEAWDALCARQQAKADRQWRLRRNLLVGAGHAVAGAVGYLVASNLIH